ncbi:MAG: ElyC/SanA/YdcF family protein, partial [Raoultibacter sp.]
RMAKSKINRLVTGLLLGMVCVVVVLAGIVALTNALVVGAAKEKIVSVDTALQSSAEAIVVLGASVLPSGEPSGILSDRLDVAIELYRGGAAPKLIMSGDNAEASYNECAAMKNYAVARGVPSEDVFCDHAGLSTYETMYRARYVFGAQRVVIVTQTYHLSRAVYAADGLGMEALGVPSDLHTYSNQSHYDRREILARTKDFFQVLFKVPVSLVGGPVSLDQSGDVTG